MTKICPSTASIPSIYRSHSSGLPLAIWQALVAQPSSQKVSSTEISYIESHAYAIKFFHLAQGEDLICLENTSQRPLRLNLKVAESVYLLSQIRGAAKLSATDIELHTRTGQNLIVSLAANTSAVDLRINPEAKIFLLQLPHNKFASGSGGNSSRGGVKNLGYHANQTLSRCVGKIDSMPIDAIRPKAYLFGKICQLYAAIIDDSFIKPDDNIESINIDVCISVVRKAESILKENITSPPTLNFLVKEIGTNRNKLLKSFKFIHGVTIFEYCQRERMLRAQFMLENKAYSVAKVAEAVGYKHPANFSLAYKKHFGEAPKKTQIKAQL